MVIGGFFPGKKTRYRMMKARNKMRQNVEKDPSQSSGSSTPRTNLNVQHLNVKQALLEQLPTELLQDIFLLSANLHLPLCSKQLLSALSSDHLTFEIAIQMLHYQSDQIGRVEMNSLLSRRFFTWNFVVKYALFAHTRAADTEMEWASIAADKDDDSSENDGLNNGSSSSSSSSSSSDESAESEDGSRYGVTSVNARIANGHPDEHDFEIYLTDILEEGMTSIPIDGTKRLVDFEMHSLETAHALRRLRGFQGLKHLDIPEKLLHRGWDNDRLRLLRLLVLFGCKVDRSGTAAGEVAENGVFDAIGEDEEEVLWHLLGQNIKVEPTQDMLRRAMRASKVKVIFQILASGAHTLDLMDPLTWRLYEDNKDWSKAEKEDVQRWLTEGVSSPITEKDKVYLPSLRVIRVNRGHWLAGGKQRKRED